MWPCRVCSTSKRTTRSMDGSRRENEMGRPRLLLFEELLQIGEALDRDLIPGRLDPAPDRRGTGDHLHIGRKRLDHDIALVANVVQRLHNRLPINVVTARSATVAATRVEVSQMFASFPDRLSLILLLDVHVERVEVQFDCRAADRLEQLQSLVTGVEEVGLKAIERLDAKL